MPDAGIGHNQPPEPIERPALGAEPETWAGWMDHVLADPIKRLNELLPMDQRFKAGFDLRRSAIPGGAPVGIEKWDQDVYKRCASAREKFRDLVKWIENLHEREKEPILAAGRVVDGKKNALLAMIGLYDSKKRLIAGGDAPLNRIADRTTIYADWLDSERKRAQAEEAARLEAEARAQAAKAAETESSEAFEKAAEAFGQAEQAQADLAAPAAERTRVHGAAGGVMSLRTHWEFVPEESSVLELAAAVLAGRAPANFLTFDTTRIGYEVRSGKPPLRECPGLVIRERRST